jgi:16S rRNA (guanine966-N2)-methyltransferase
MRVIAGSLKGRRLKAPTWDGLRPTSDKLRETLFNILAPRIAGATVLDGFAGTGAVGIEALSRGATRVTFVESDRRAQTLIDENLAHCGVENGYAIIRATVARAIVQLDAAAFGPYELFDIVWLDPPYDEPPGPVLAAADVLIAPGGLLVLEHARRVPAPDTAGRLVRVRQVTSGDSTLSFYELKTD